jgi:inositol-phosphate transport system permease protein
MSSSARLGLVMLAPAFVIVALLFLAPVALTGVFSFTSMTTATGITGGAYQLTDDAIARLRSQGLSPALAEALSSERYAINEATLRVAKADGLPEAMLAELASKHMGESFPDRREFERFLKTLAARPANTTALKSAGPPFRASLFNVRFETDGDFDRALDSLGVTIDSPTRAKIVREAFTGWHWTTANYERLLASPDTLARLGRTVFYVAATNFLFNTGFGLVLAVATFYLPPATGAAIRAFWLIPRIMPVVIYVMLWKWLAWDTGFLSTVLSPLGVAPRNWLLDNAVNAWIFVLLINGFIGASMGMIIFSSAIRAIPETLFHASSVDGASTLQQVRHVILPQLKWPILFVTCYQTLSLFASFQEILLSTDGGPGAATEVWSLAAYHTALMSYTGNLQYGMGATLAVVLVIIGITVSLVYLRLFNFAALVARPRIEQ